MNELTRPGGILPRLWFAMRANRAFRFQVYLAAFLAITMLGRCADLLRERDSGSAVTFTNSDGANAIKTGSTFTVGGSAVIATIRAIATGADYVAPNQASVQLDCG